MIESSKMTQSPIYSIMDFVGINESVSNLSYISSVEDLELCLISGLNKVGFEIWKLPDENTLLNSNKNFVIYGDGLKIQPKIGGIALSLNDNQQKLFSILKTRFSKLRINNYLSPSSIRLTETQISSLINGYGWLLLVVEVNPFRKAKLHFKAKSKNTKAKIKLVVELRNRGELLYNAILLTHVDEFLLLKNQVLDKIELSPKNGKVFSFDVVADLFPKTVFQFKLAEILNWTGPFINLFQKDCQATYYANFASESQTKKSQETVISTNTQTPSSKIVDVVTELKFAVTDLTNKLSKMMKLPSNVVESSIKSLDEEIKNSTQPLLDNAANVEIEQNKENNELLPEEMQILYIIQTLRGASRSQLKKILYFTDQMLRECLDQLIMKGRIRFDDQKNQYIPSEVNRDE